MKEQIRYLGAMFSILVIWQILAMLTSDFVVPEPVVVFKLLFSEIQEKRFWVHVLTSLYRVIGGLLISFVTAVPLGLLIGTSNRFDRWTQPMIYLTYPIPKIVLLPLVFLFFGISDGGKIAMIALILFFQLLVTTRDSAREVSDEMRYSLLSLGGNKLDLFIHVIWPSCLPAIFSALRVATGTVVAVLFFVESIGTRHGMGFYILDAWGRAATPQIFVGILVLAFIGVGMYETFDLLEKALCKWKRGK